MHFFVNGKDLKAALAEFKRAKIKGLVLVGSDTNETVTLDAYTGDLNKTGPVTIPERRLRVTIPARYTDEWTSRGSFKCDLKDLEADADDVEISEDCFGLLVNGDLRASTETSANNMPWENVAEPVWTGRREITPEDSKAIAWVREAIDKESSRGFDHLSLSGARAEATNGHWLARAAVSGDGPEMYMHWMIADLAAGAPGVLSSAKSDDGTEWAQYRAPGIILETARKADHPEWPEFDKVFPKGAPSVQVHVPHLRDTVKAAVNGYSHALVNLCCSLSQRKMSVAGIEIKHPMKPPYDTLERTCDSRTEIAMLDDPSTLTALAGVVTYNAAYLVPLLAGFAGNAQMSLRDAGEPLMFADEARTAVIMSID